MLWDIFQEVEIQNLRSRSNLADTEAQLHRQATRDRHEDLADDVARLALVTEAMWEVLKDRFGVTDAELVAKVRELDLADGVADGQRTKRPRPCPSCQAVVPPDREACQFCGTPAPGASTFS